MTTLSNPRQYAGDVKVGTLQTHVPNRNIQARIQGFLEGGRDGVAAKGGFESKVFSETNSLFKLEDFCLPGEAVGFFGW